MNIDLGFLYDLLVDAVLLIVIGKIRWGFWIKSFFMDLLGLDCLFDILVKKLNGLLDIWVWSDISGEDKNIWNDGSVDSILKLLNFMRFFKKKGI